MNEMFEFINTQVKEDLEDMMNGKAIKVNRIELNTLVTYMNDIGINTLMIQKSNDGYYIMVDGCTIDAWKEKENNYDRN